MDRGMERIAHRQPTLSGGRVNSNELIGEESRERERERDSSWQLLANTVADKSSKQHKLNLEWSQHVNAFDLKTSADIIQSIHFSTCDSGKF